MDKIYEMKLHEFLIIGEKNIQVIRVPGGWIYESFSFSGPDGSSIASCFVPFSTEFV